MKYLIFSIASLMVAILFFALAPLGCNPESIPQPSAADLAKVRSASEYRDTFCAAVHLVAPSVPELAQADLACYRGDDLKKVAKSWAQCPEAQPASAASEEPSQPAEENQVAEPAAK